MLDRSTCYFSPESKSRSTYPIEGQFYFGFVPLRLARIFLHILAALKFPVSCWQHILLQYFYNSYTVKKAGDISSSSIFKKLHQEKANRKLHI